MNRLFSDGQQWTGQRLLLEDQAIKASDQSPELLVKNLGAIPYYQEQHRKVFGTDLNADGVAKAIAAYERTILSGNSPYDRFKAGDKKALSAAAQRGLALFEGKARCVTCHVSFNFTDENYHNLGVGIDKPNPDLGRFTVTKNDEHKGAFKTPTLRDVAKRPPYMHDGSHKTLEEVIALYNKGGIPNPWLSKEIRPLNLTATEPKKFGGLHGSANGSSCAGGIESAEITGVTQSKENPPTRRQVLQSRGILEPSFRTVNF